MVADSGGFEMVAEFGGVNVEARRDGGVGNGGKGALSYSIPLWRRRRWGFGECSSSVSLRTPVDMWPMEPEYERGLSATGLRERCFLEDFVACLGWGWAVSV